MRKNIVQNASLLHYNLQIKYLITHYAENIRKGKQAWQPSPKPSHSDVSFLQIGEILFCGWGNNFVILERSYSVKNVFC